MEEALKKGKVFSNWLHGHTQEVNTFLVHIFLSKKNQVVFLVMGFYRCFPSTFLCFYLHGCNGQKKYPIIIIFLSGQSNKHTQKSSGKLHILVFVDDSEYCVNVNLLSHRFLFLFHVVAF